MLLSNPWRHKCDPLEDEIRWAPHLFLRLEKWLPYRLSLWGGDISYMVYLLHLPTLWLFARFVSPALPQGMPSLGMALALVMILGIFVLMTYFVWLNK